MIEFIETLSLFDGFMLLWVLPSLTTFMVIDIIMFRLSDKQSYHQMPSKDQEVALWASILWPAFYVVAVIALIIMTIERIPKPKINTKFLTKERKWRDLMPKRQVVPDNMVPLVQAKRETYFLIALGSFCAGVMSMYLVSFYG